MVFSLALVLGGGAFASSFFDLLPHQSISHILAYDHDASFLGLSSVVILIVVAKNVF